MKNIKIVYNVITRDQKTYWNRIGVAFQNRDGSINVRLDAIPINGEMQIRDYISREDTVKPEEDSDDWVDRIKY